jgi:aminobenzoyl-glutamate utilization protein B
MANNSNSSSKNDPLPDLIEPTRLSALKQAVVAEIDRQKDLTQQMVDMLFSFAELGFQEFETSRYLTNILKQNGFHVEEGVAGIPTAWIAKWGSGKPVIAIGSDLDCLPNTSQKPGVAYHEPLVEGAPGHGEGHNSGQAVNVTAALAVKKIMESEGLSGTLMLWPGIAEEQLATKAYYVRDGYFKDVDANFFSHVGNNFHVAYGDMGWTGLLSIKFTFEGEAAHAAASPWKGRSALDAVELMNIGWNYKREHLELTQRSHYVITEGGDQPNVVPSRASVWYYFREWSYPKIKELVECGIQIAQGAAMMTGTTVTYTTLGSAWPGHMNRPLATAVHENAKTVGLPQWDEADQQLAKATQREVGSSITSGLSTELPPLASVPGTSMGGGSDDIGDISWNVPTVVMRFPANIPGLPVHHWASAISMATPIAHKGATAGAKVEALTLLDMLAKPQLIADAWDYFHHIQTKETQYIPLISASDWPAIDLNQQTMAKFRPEMQKYYFDPTKYKTYLEQLGIAYPTIKSED